MRSDDDENSALVYHGELRNLRGCRRAKLGFESQLKHWIPPPNQIPEGRNQPGMGKMETHTRNGGGGVSMVLRPQLRGGSGPELCFCRFANLGHGGGTACECEAERGKKTEEHRTRCTVHRTSDGSHDSSRHEAAAAVVGLCGGILYAGWPINGPFGSELSPFSIIALVSRPPHLRRRHGPLTPRSLPIPAPYHLARPFRRRLRPPPPRLFRRCGFKVDDYLVSRCGLTRAQAVKAAAKLSHLRSRAKPEAVLTYLENNLGIPSADVGRVPVICPLFLCSDVERTLAPRVADLRYLGLSRDDIARLVLLVPNSFRYRHLTSNLEFWLAELGSFDKIVRAIMLCSQLLSTDLDKVTRPNVAFLQQCGMNISQIATTSLYSTRLFTMNPKLLKDTVQRAEELGVDRGSRMFRHALALVAFTDEEVVARRIRLLRNLGFSKDDVRTIVRKQPVVLALSEQKPQPNLFAPTAVFRRRPPDRHHRRSAMVISHLRAALSRIVRSQSRIPTSSHAHPLVSPHRILGSSAAAAAFSSSSFAVEDYLVSRCGLTKAQALKAAAKLPHLRFRAKPEAVLAYLENTLGVPHAGIARAIVMDPTLLCCNVEKTLVPRVAELHEVGLSRDEIARLVPLAPKSLRSSFLRSNLEFWLGELGSFDKLLLVLRRCSSLLTADLDKIARPNVALLRECGMNISKVAATDRYSSMLFIINPRYLKDSVQRVEEMGIHRAAGVLSPHRALSLSPMYSHGAPSSRSTRGQASIASDHILQTMPTTSSRAP
ncbi:hypothetical protein HU200_051954 [Digitaria exilis]|uniref:Uncharacterized protein n=1 Tax=Digitaria exilis TaxID=1010633 RepID=A0A835E6A1_9POAL|nr:hypothetical protein HU200_051954 [Digitaria exilis]